MTANSSRAAASTWVLGSVVDAFPALQRHDALWFEDGNVIITADDGCPLVAFRLHRGVLSLHSEFFRDMFSLPHYPGNDEVVDGCPIVHSSDCVQHLVWLFTILYEGVREYVNDHSRLSYSIN